MDEGMDRGGTAPMPTDPPTTSQAWRAPGTGAALAQPRVFPGHSGDRVRNTWKQYHVCQWMPRSCWL